MERNFAAPKEIISREKAEKELISDHPQRLRVSFPGKRKKISSLYLQLSSRDCALHKRLRFERENEGDDLFK